MECPNLLQLGKLTTQGSAVKGLFNMEPLEPLHLQLSELIASESVQ